MEQSLAPYAVTCSISRGRCIHESPHSYRTDFERDRDRIIHSAAFRRLEGKTQVFTPGLNDHYRTRLTHSIEVAQIGRTIAQALEVNESLTEAICLAHDLGHSPFGHAGEQVLSKLMKEYGGFEHNRQSLRIVDFLEHPYPNFAGLNLMFETRQGLAGHHSPYDQPEIDTEFGTGSISLEGQISNLADRIAYNTHDLEDGIRARLLEEEQIQTLELIRSAREKISAETIDDFVIRRTRTAKAILDTLVSDAIESSRKLIAQHGIDSLEKVYGHSELLIQLNPSADRQLHELEQFLLNNMYLHQKLKQAAHDIECWLMRLFEKFCQNSGQMPRYFQKLIDSEGLQQTVCDYISGMTDRYALSLLK